MTLLIEMFCATNQTREQKGERVKLKMLIASSVTANNISGAASAKGFQTM